jgi:hypothetical protein
MKTYHQHLLFAACVSTLVLAQNFGAAADSTSTYSGPEKSFTGAVTAVDLSQHTVKVRSDWLYGKTFNLGPACAYSLLDGVAGPCATPVG